APSACGGRPPAGTRRRAPPPGSSPTWGRRRSVGAPSSRAPPTRACGARVPWAGRSEDKLDEGVWAVTCFVTRAGFRKRGVSRALARAAVEHARAHGARAVEGYPIEVQPGKIGRAHV